MMNGVEEIRFNPALGFLPVSTPAHRLRRVRGGPVSIPLWVFSPSRPVASTMLITAFRTFQSRSGFSPRLDLWTMTSPARPNSCFNPALGFLPVSTRCRRRASGGDYRFNPALGFLPVSTLRTGVRRQDDRVSIPLWVFSPSRRPIGWPSIPETTGFNPALGFLPVSTRSPMGFNGSMSCFNPALGFLPVSTDQILAL